MTHLEIQNIIKVGITVYGRVSQSDIIGAVFGQTEDVLGESLELRRLQKDNKIGRIEVDVDTSGDVTKGIITIPSSLDKVTNVIIAAALETIQKIGPCKASAKVIKLEDIKELKIKEIIARAKKVLEKFMSISINSSELVEDVISSVNMSQMEHYGKLPVGPQIKHFDEVIFVETVEELKNLLKYGIKNVAAFEDMSNVEDIKKLASEHEITVFVNRGREFLVKKLMEIADMDNMAKADPGKKIEHLTSKELFKCIRGAVACKQFAEAPQKTYHSHERKTFHRPERRVETKPFHDRRNDRRDTRRSIPPRETEVFRSTIQELEGSNQAIVLDYQLHVLGKVPVEGLSQTVSSLSGKIHSVIVNGPITRDLVQSAERSRVKYLVGKSAETNSRFVRIVTNI